MDRYDFNRLDTEQKWVVLRQWLEPLASFAAGKYYDNRDDDDATYSGKYLERVFRVRVNIEDGRPKLEAKVNNERGSLDVRLARGPLDPLPEADPNWSDEPAKARHFLNEHLYIEDEQPEVARQAAMLVGLLPNLVAQLFYSFGADGFDLRDDVIEVGFGNYICDSPQTLPAQMQGALDVVQQIARELGA